MQLSETFLCGTRMRQIWTLRKSAEYTTTTEDQVKQGPSAIRMKGYELPSPTESYHKLTTTCWWKISFYSDLIYIMLFDYVFL